MNQPLVVSGALFVLAYLTLMCLLFSTMNFAVVVGTPDCSEVRKRKRSAAVFVIGGIASVIALYQLGIYVVVNGVGL